MRWETGQSGTLCRAVLDRLREADCTGIDHCCRVPPSAAWRDGRLVRLMATKWHRGGLHRVWTTKLILP